MNPGMSLMNLIGLLLALAGAVVAGLSAFIANRLLPEYEHARVWLKLGGSAVTIVGLLMFLDYFI